MAYSIFIAGENVDLCVPSEAAISDGWADWFNDDGVTRWTTHGLFPNTVEDQHRFLASIRERSRFAVLICDKGGNELLGIISLSAIDLFARSAQISLVIGKKTPPKKLMQLEAMALVTEHAFEKLNLNRVWACQPFPAHAGFNKSLEIIGYSPEGILRESFRRGRLVSDAVTISCLASDYNAILMTRAKLWPGMTDAQKMIMDRRGKSLAEKIEEAIKELRKDHLKFVISEALAYSPADGAMRCIKDVLADTGASVEITPYTPHTIT